jgi:DinB superfamily/Pentapeptide repeats (9 copies)
LHDEARRALDASPKSRQPGSVTDFTQQNLSGSVFEDVSLKDARFHDVTLAGATFEQVDLSGVTIRDAYFMDVEINADIANVRINGVDVVPLIEAELDRRYPGRVKMRPTDADGFREAWDLLEVLWPETVARARGLPPELLHESVDGEWSFTETLRHLVFATDAWVRRGILGDPAPWSPLDLPWDQMPDTPGIPRDRDVRPSLDEVLTLRADRMGTVRRMVDELTDDRLDEMTEPVPGPGWPESRSYSVRHCLEVILNEEWEHRLYAERDLDVLAAGAPDALLS